MYRSSRYWACSCIESVIRSVHNPGDGAQNSRKLQDTSATSYVSAAAIERVIPNQAQLLKRGDAEARRRIWSELANSAPDINTHGLNLPIFLRVSAFKTSCSFPFQPASAWLGMTQLGWRSGCSVFDIRRRERVENDRRAMSTRYSQQFRPVFGFRVC